MPFSSLGVSLNYPENVTGGSSDLRLHNSLARWSAIPLLYSLAKWVPGLMVNCKQME